MVAMNENVECAVVTMGEDWHWPRLVLQLYHITDPWVKGF